MGGGGGGSLGPRPPPFLPSVCIHNNTRERKTGEKHFRRSSAPVYYCERKRKVKTGEAREGGGGLPFWHVPWRAWHFNGSPAFSEHVPIMFTPTSFITTAEYAIQKPEGQTLSSPRDSLACKTTLSKAK